MTETEINHFLIVYDIAAGNAKVKPFGHDYDAALAAYAKAEEDLRGSADPHNFDIVLVGADSLKTVERTHSSYFHTEETFESLLPSGVLVH
jgi:hypothetical protein